MNIKQLQIELVNALSMQEGIEKARKLLAVQNYCSQVRAEKRNEIFFEAHVRASMLCTRLLNSEKGHSARSEIGQIKKMSQVSFNRGM